MQHLFLKIVGLVVVLFAVIYLMLPTGPREQMGFDDPWRQPRPVTVASDYIVVTGNPWATEAALAIMQEGGNAFDAGVAAMLTLNVTYGEAASFPGVAPLLIYSAKDRKVRSYIGAGKAPAAATIELYKSRGHEFVPLYDTLAQLIPASPDTLFRLLQDYGTLHFSQVSRRAIELARTGFPVHHMMIRNLDLSLLDRIGFSILMPYNSQVYLRGEWWRPLHLDDRFIRPDLANTLQAIADAESQALASGASRAEGLAAARAYFYTGPVAEKIVGFHGDHNGLFSREDLASYAGDWELPVEGTFGKYRILTNGTWSQGIVVPMVMQILEGMDLRAMGLNSPQYIHTVLQAIELAMADREAYVADPAFIPVPVAELLDKGYARQRQAAMRPLAFGKMPNPGIPASGIPDYAKPVFAYIRQGEWPIPGSYELQADYGKDTSYLGIIDRWGNSISLTPSDFPTSPMVPGTGVTLGVRMTQFRLMAEHPAALAPGKRPRITPHALMLLKDDEFYMSIGTPGGDMQTQASIQVLLNHLIFGMDIQQAIDAPRFRSNNFPDSFAPHQYRPGTIEMEQGLMAQQSALKALGYRIDIREDWDHHFSAVGAVIKTDQGLVAGSDPREETWADGR